MEQDVETTILTERDLNHPETRKRALYAAFSSRDPRFDGRVFVGVSSTGIYCRTVCSAHMPKYENCTFFHTAAEAEAAGYRPCLRCRPEMAPGLSSIDANASLARRAAELLRENCATGLDLQTLAAKLGYTDRHLRRVFIDGYGVTPSQYVQTCRLLLAKSLLTDSGLPVSAVARASGFGSVRRFNDAFKKQYHLTPTNLRKQGGKGERGQIALRLGYRAPYQFDKLLSFFEMRVMEGVEKVEDGAYLRTARIPLADGTSATGWVRVANDEKRHALVVTMSESLLVCVPAVVARVRRQFDTDCDPFAIAEKLASLDDAVPGAAVPGTRVPGCFDAFETCCRAILGQQVTVAAANRLAARVAHELGKRIDTGIEGLDRSFPTAAEICAIDDIEGTLGPLGVIKTRSRAIAQIARLIEEGELDFGPGAPIEEQMERLLSIKGIGPWSANYIAMRTLGYTDAFLETDSGIAHALPDLSPKERLELAEQWRPWRSYANLSLWNSLA
ncbi:MAG: DNA-3-methyladenine glycosylase 2 family protein [Coriobacteriales bacterium]|jgi:AraC family transcriptional regulator of adaptative response / DNA-3-methyladenine glycosylase II